MQKRTEKIMFYISEEEKKKFNQKGSKIGIINVRLFEI